MKIFTLFFLLLGIVAFGIGMYMLLDSSILNNLPSAPRTVMAILLALYGIFRISTSIGALKKKHETSK